MSYSIMELGPDDVYEYVREMFGKEKADSLDGHDKEGVAYLAGKAFKEDVFSVPEVWELYQNEIYDALESEGII